MTHILIFNYLSINYLLFTINLTQADAIINSGQNHSELCGKIC